ncbi:MAG TPA: hypothetical protein VJB63_03280 [Patescibacteria group bacterium]|nr:hypothetical protein [Patescibacteria group bacterium]
MTLTELSHTVRRSIVPSVFGFILLIALYFVISNYLNYLASQRPKTIVIEPIFGKINKLALKNTFQYSTKSHFVLDTIEGRPKTATDTAKVYFLPPKITKFGYLQTVFLMAKKLGFHVDEIKHTIKNNTVLFEDEEKSVQINIANYNFTYAYKYDDNLQVFDDVTFPEDTTIKEKIKGFLSDVGRYPEELAQGKEDLSFLIYDRDTKQFTPTTRKNEANAVEFDLYRPDINSFPAVSPSYFGSHNYALAVFQSDTYTVLKAQISFFEKENEKIGIYPLKTGSEAWDELKNKQGFIVSEGESKDTITIKKMFLAYVDPDIYQSYVQPVYVFLSADGFAGYISAIKDEYLE